MSGVNTESRRLELICRFNFSGTRRSNNACFTRHLPERVVRLCRSEFFQSSNAELNASSSIAKLSIPIVRCCDVVLRWLGYLASLQQASRPTPHKQVTKEVELPLSVWDVSAMVVSSPESDVAIDDCLAPLRGPFQKSICVVRRRRGSRTSQTTGATPGRDP